MRFLANIKEEVEEYKAERLRSRADIDVEFDV